jgi:VanZ family protein
MSLSPATPGIPSDRAGRHHAWTVVSCGLAVILLESSPLGGGNNTGRLLHAVWPNTLAANWNPSTFGMVHHLLRKLGHFTGYGTLALLLREAWHRSLRALRGIAGVRLLVAASALSVAVTCLTGCVDEWHQTTVPGRTGCWSDVLIDTSGALLFNLVFCVLRARRSQQTRPRWFTPPQPSAG